MNIKEILKTKKNATIGGAAILAVILIAGIVTSINAYASEAYWDLKAGNETIGVFNTEEEAKAVIDTIKNKFVEEGNDLVALTIEPELTIVETSYKVSEAPVISTKKEVLEYLFTGTEEAEVYVAQENDSLSAIAEANGISIDKLLEMNPDKGLDKMIYPGDEFKLYTEEPVIKVYTEELVKREEAISYRTIEKETEDLYKGDEEVETEGKDGLANVVETVKKENGVVVETIEKGRSVSKSPVNKVILVGTKEKAPVVNYDNAGTFPGNGYGVAAFARQFVGGPYAYGGSSLTNGADCSGFVKAVYANFGISLPHGSDYLRSYGRGVSMGEALPGDIIINPGHCGIYIGGGQMVHAVNDRLGIAVTSVSYTGPVIAIRRIVE